MSALSDKHAIVTGAGRGLGGAIAHALAAQGASITLVGRKKEALENSASDLRVKYGIRTHIAPLDVTDENGVKEGFKRAIDALGVPFVLVNNAGAAESSPIQSMTTDHWERMISVNLTGVFYCTREVVRMMREKKAGRIINVSSTAGIRGYRYVAAYCAAKHGVIGLTKSLAIELASYGITVNAVCPGFADTDLFQKSVEEVVKKTGRTKEEITKEFLKDAPGGRLVTPEEVATKVLWFCQKEQSNVTGEAVVIEGV